MHQTTHHKTHDRRAGWLGHLGNLRVPSEPHVVSSCEGKGRERYEMKGLHSSRFKQNYKLNCMTIWDFMQGRVKVSCDNMCLLVIYR